MERLIRNHWMRFFETKFTVEVEEFLSQLDPKTIRKVIYNIDLAEQTNDSTLFKKLQKGIWEFRIKFARQHIRLLAFWDKNEDKKTLVIVTHGFIKKTDKVPDNEIDRAIKLRNKYFNRK